MSCQKGNSSKDKPVVELILGHDMPSDSPLDLGARRFAEIVKFKTKGEVKVKVIGNQKLGTDQQMIQKLLKGNIDFIIPPVAKMNFVDNEFELLDHPFIFKNASEAQNQLDNQFLKYFKDRVLRSNSKVELLGFWESGFKQITSNKKINSTEDFKNINFRVMKSKRLEMLYKKLQANIIGIDFHQISKALKDGVIDGQENPIGSIYSLDMYKFQKYLFITNHSYLSQAFLMSKNVLEKVNQEHVEIIKKAQEDALIYQREQVSLYEKRQLEAIKRYGTIIVEDDSLRKDLEKKWNALKDNFLKEHLDFKLILDEKHEKKLYIGLDLSLKGKTASSGKAIERGVQLALDEINEEGGVLGKKLDFISKNNNGFPDQGVKNISEFLVNQDVVAIMGGMHSPVALAELNLIHQNPKIFLIPWAAATKIIDNGYLPNFTFRYSVRDEFAGQVLYNYAVKKKMRKVCLLLEQTPWGDGNLQTIKKAAQMSRNSIQDVKRFLWGQESFIEILNSFSDQSCDGIIFVGNSPEGEKLVKEMVKLELQIPIISHWGITGGNFFSTLEKELEKIDLVFLQTFNAHMPNPSERVEKFKEKYINKFSSQNVSHYPAFSGTIHAYELTKMLANALRKVNSLNPNDIHRSLKQTTRHVGVFKTSHNPFLNSQDALGLEDLSLCRYKTGGRINCE